MKKTIGLIISGIVCCVTLAAPALADPIGTLESHTFSVTPMTHWYPGASDMLNVEATFTIDNSTPGYGDTSVYVSNAMTYNQSATGSTRNKNFYVVEGTIQSLSAFFDGVCGAKPENIPNSTISCDMLYMNADVGDGYVTFGHSSRIYTGSP